MCGATYGWQNRANDLRIVVFHFHKDDHMTTDPIDVSSTGTIDILPVTVGLDCGDGESVTVIAISGEALPEPIIVGATKE